MSFSNHFDSEVGAVIGTEGITEHLKTEQNQMNMLSFLLSIELLEALDACVTPKLTSNFSELCMPGMDCMRWEVGWLPKSELT